MRRIVALIAALGFSTLILLWGRTPRDIDTIPELFIVGTTADFWPFSFRKDGIITGFDIDIAKEVVKRINKKMIIRDVPFASLIAQLELGTLDIVAAGLAATPEREARVNFSTPYVGNNPLVIVSYNRSIQQLENLQGKTVYVTVGNALTYLGKLNLDIKIKVINNDGVDMHTALDIMDNDDVIVTELLSLDPQIIQQFKLSIVELAHTDQHTALAVAKNSRVLLSEINRALESMEHDGTLQRLRSEWSIG